MHEINLIPEEILLARLNNRRKVKYIMIILFLIIIGILLYNIIDKELTTIKSQLFYVEHNLKFLKSELNHIVSDKEDIIYIKEAESFLQSIKDKNKLQWASIIKDIRENIPDQIQVSSLKIDNSYNLVLEGRTYSLAFIADLIDAMKKMPFIENVQLTHIKNINEKFDEQIYVFKITSGIKGMIAFENKINKSLQFNFQRKKDDITADYYGLFKNYIIGFWAFNNRIC